MATYSMKVRKPEGGDPAAAERVLAGTAAYATPAETIASQDAEAQRLVQEFRDKLEEMEGDGAPGNSGSSPAAARGNLAEPAEAGDGSE